MIEVVKPSKRKAKEEQFYEPIKSALQKELEEFVGFEGNVYLEITAKGSFSDELKEVFDKPLLAILRVEKFPPDITGFIQKKDSSRKELITVEIKPDRIKINHIYKAKMYADVFDARYGLIVSPKRLQEEIRRFVKEDRYTMLNRYNGNFIIAQFDKANNKFKFDKKLYSTIPEPFKSAT